MRDIFSLKIAKPLATLPAGLGFFLPSRRARLKAKKVPPGQQAQGVARGRLSLDLIMTRLQPNPIELIAPATLGGDDANPCLSCGACCAHFRVSFYCGEVAGENGGLVPLELVRPISPLRVCMSGTEKGGGRCVALRGELGQPGIHCDIYALRPTPCREFEVWQPDGSVNPDCQRLRANLGLPPIAPRPDAENDPQGPSTPIQPAAA